MNNTSYDCQSISFISLIFQVRQNTKNHQKSYSGLCSCTLLAMHEGLLVATVPVQVRVGACFKGHNLMILPRRWFN